jgi:hypothetical protein
VQCARQQELLRCLHNDFRRGRCRLRRLCHRREVKPGKVKRHVKSRCRKRGGAKKKCKSGSAEFDHVSPLILDRFVINLI